MPFLESNIFQINSYLSVTFAFACICNKTKHFHWSWS